MRSVADLAGAPGLVAGRCVRLLLDAGLLDADAAAGRLARALSARDGISVAVRWLEGFLRGSGLLLVRDARLWQLLDDWLCSLRPEQFDEVLPLLRRAFAQFPWPERRQMGDLVRSGQRSAGSGLVAEEEWHFDRVRLILPVLAAALGVPAGPAAPAGASAGVADD